MHPDTSPAVTSSEFLAIESQIKSHRYKDAFRLAAERFGDFRQWRHPKLSLMASRCLNHLGQPRTADAIVFWAWRRHPGNPDLALPYLEVIRGIRGPLAALNLCRRIREPADVEKKAELDLYESFIFSCYRDFERAEALVHQASEHLPREKVLMQQADLEFRQDNLETALNYTNQALALSEHYRYAIQVKAQILLNLGRSSEAADLLFQAVEYIQSVPVAAQLFGILVEQNRVAEAEKLLAHIQSLIINAAPETERLFNALNADLLCAQQRYEEALPFIEKTSYFWRSVSDSMKQHKGQGERRVIDVPFIAQKHMTCAPASIASICAFWGSPISQEEIIREICYDGTPAVDERNWIVNNGWHCVEFELDLDIAKQLIDRGYPVLLNTVEPTSAHLQVLVGYDERMGVYLLRDPNSPRLQELLIEAGHKRYAATGPRCVLMLPAARRAAVEDLNFPAAGLYDIYFSFSLALDKYDRSLAFEHYKRLLDVDKDHRLTLVAKRVLARFDLDSVGELSAVEALLKRFPDDVGLKLQKVNLIATVGSNGELLEYLDRIDSEHGFNIYIKSQLAYHLRYDLRQSDRLHKLFSSLLARQPTDPLTLESYACFLWNAGDKSGSFEIYRLLTCLEDKVESYAESYFQAARHFKETEKALEFLVSRYNKLINQKSYPVISLYNALRCIDREQEGIEYLRRAMEIWPDEGELKLYSARQLLNLGDAQSCRELIDKVGGNANRFRLMELKADLAEFTLDRAAAIGYWLELLAYEPLNGTANAAVTRIYWDMGQEDKALEFIDRQIEKYPGNYGLLRTKLNYLDNSSACIDERKAALEALVMHHPDDAWGYCQLAYSYLAEHQLDRALEYAQAALSRSRHDGYYQLCLGEVYVARQTLADARAAFRKAIALSCDLEGAFEKLLSCVFDVEEIKQELEFVRKELLRQVSFGNGILNYQSVASRWGDSARLGQFLKLALEERPDLWQSWVALSRHHAETADLSAALNVLDGASRRFPLLPVIFAERAEIHYLLGDADVCRQDLLEALSLSPGWPRVSHRLSDLYTAAGEFARAIACLEKSLARHPGEAVSHGYLADLHWRYGDKSKAFMHIEKAVEISPYYRWAWSKLKEWSVEEHRTVNLLDKIAGIRRKLPNNETLLSIHADLADTYSEKVEILSEFHREHPGSEQASLALARLHAEHGQFDAAWAVCNASAWADNAPTAIKAERARLDFQRDRIREAIEAMERIVGQDPNFYEGWRCLTLWYGRTNQPEKAVTAVYRCRDLMPNDPSVLCFFAETLSENKEHAESIVAEALRRACQIDPTDSYIALTYIDMLLDTADLDTAEAVIGRAQLLCDNVFLSFRKLRLAGERNDTEAFLSRLEPLLCAPDVNDWIAYHSWQLVKKLKLIPQTCQLIDSLMDSGRCVAPLFGEYQAYYLIEKHGPDKFARTLIERSPRDAFFDRQLEAYLRIHLDLNKKVPEKVVERLKDRLLSDVNNWGLYGQLLFHQEHWHAAHAWFQGALQREDAKPWILYLASMAARNLGHWQQGEALIERAYRMDSDNYREDIQIWYFFDAYLRGQKPDLQTLNWMRTDNLTNVSRYTFALLKVLIALGEGTFMAGYPELSPLLRDVQHAHQSVVGMALVSSAQRRVRQRLRATIDGSLIQKWFWRWRLSNHF